MVRVFMLLLLFPLVMNTARAERSDQHVDVVIYGATPCGIAAAIASAKQGRSVLLIEPTARIGGLVTSGLSHTDFHSFESLTGAFLDFSRRVEAHYVEQYGADSPQARDSFRGTFAEPKVNLSTFHTLLDEQKRIRLRTSLVLVGVSVVKGDPMSHIDGVACKDGQGNHVSVTGDVFIDATYEGDLMAAAGVPYRIGREGKSDYGESLAPEVGDALLQAYNFRFCMTQDPSNRVTPQAPAGYRREDFVGVLQVLDTGRIRNVFGYPKDCIFKAQTPPLPNGKYDINDVSQSLVRLSLPGQNLEWPDGTPEQRREVFERHLRDQVGLLFFLQNDPAVPEKYRHEAREWGWCADEFVETEHLPPQLYVREARRMEGTYVFRQSDSEHAVDGEWKDARAVCHPDAIAMGDYGNNCHGAAHDGPRFGGRHTGDFYNPVPPYQIPYGVIVPKSIDNLLVPGAVSSSHVGFCALRLEPIWMSLGQAAGHAADQALAGTLHGANVSVQSIDVPRLQTALHRDRSATIYVSDVLPDHPDFAAVQWWGTRGGFHGLEPMPNKPGQRGKSIHGQYYEANPGHEARLDVTLDAATLERWNRKYPEMAARGTGFKTRGEWIRAAYAMFSGQD